MSKTKILGLIPARGGSKGFLKNLILLIINHLLSGLLNQQEIQIY